MSILTVAQGRSGRVLHIGEAQSVPRGPLIFQD